MVDSSIDLERVRAFLAEREIARKHRLEARLAEARKDAAAIVDKITARYQIDRVWQWGSLVSGDGFSERSDIDIALEGVRSPQDFFGIIGIAMDESDFSVDVIELDQVRPTVAERIRRTGRLVYERKRR